MDVDQRRKLVFMARDPRAYNGTTSDPTDIAGVYVVDASDPEDLVLRTFEQLPTGHTSTCVNDCDFLWTGGPASPSDKLDEWPGGRPVFVTDLRNLDDITTRRSRSTRVATTAPPRTPTTCRSTRPVRSSPAGRSTEATWVRCRRHGRPASGPANRPWRPGPGRCCPRSSTPER